MIPGPPSAIGLYSKQGRPHRSLSYLPVRHPLHRTGHAFLSEIQTAADFKKTKIVYIEVNEREQRP